MLCCAPHVALLSELCRASVACCLAYRVLRSASRVVACRMPLVAHDARRILRIASPILCAGLRVRLHFLYFSPNDGPHAKDLFGPCLTSYSIPVSFVIRFRLCFSLNEYSS